MKKTFFLLFSLFLFLLICPFVPGLLNFNYLEYIKNYLAIIGNAFTVLIGTSGVFLGYFYYQDTKKFHKENIDIRHKKEKIKIFLNELEEYDKLIILIFNKFFSNKQELTLKRDLVRQRFDSIETLLNKELLDFSKSELDILLELNSFVDKSKAIMEMNYSLLKKTNVSETKDIYFNKYLEAKKVVYLKQFNIMTR